MKKHFKFIIFLAATILLLILIEIGKPKEIDWSLSFSKDDKIPYGSFLIYKVLPDLFPNSAITETHYPVYNILKENQVYESSYIFINDRFIPDELDTKYLLDFVEAGNNVLIAANLFYGKLADTLKIYSNPKYSYSDSIEINFVNKNIKEGKPYSYKNNFFEYYFSEYDTAKVTVLGINSKGDANFIKINFGDGAFLINSLPVAFTNYNLISKRNSDYIFKAVSHLPENNTVYWDEYYKSNKASVRTPLRFILSSEPLKWAYYIMIFSVIGYIVFQGRRKQRVIPTIKGLRNTTLDFIRIVGRLYYQQKNHKNIADKRIIHFLERIRSRYFLKTEDINDETLKKLS
jgi:hypothetical protein